jgi:integrase
LISHKYLLALAILLGFAYTSAYIDPPCRWSTPTVIKSGALRARKRIPNAVRDEYARLYGVRHEAKFYASADTPTHEQRRLFSEWLSTVEGQIAAIIAARNGDGITLTPRDARALAGEWYEWFVGRHPGRDPQTWEELRDDIHDAFTAAIHDADLENALERDGDLAVWKGSPELREAVRPMLADIGETAQFLAVKGMALNKTASALFLDHLYEDLAAALRRMIRVARGDYSPDTYPQRFPTREGADSGVTPWELFERWVAERRPAQATVESWRYVFLAMRDHFKDRSAGSIMAEEAAAWIKSLITEERSAHTVKRTWLTASKTVFGWALDHKHVPRNPFAATKVTLSKEKELRDDKSFTMTEAQTILRAAAAITDTSKPIEAAKRWVPFLCAYTGARSGEIAQLRGVDVATRDGVHSLRLTPEAGAVKGGHARIVPLHEHIIAQGFLDFVAQHGKGPLFYTPTKTADGGSDPLRQKKPRYAQTRQRLAAWVRGLGVDDEHLSPNHAWRHTFKRIAERNDISERMSDYITDHAPASVGRQYGKPTLEDMAAALKKFPRYRV